MSRYSVEGTRLRTNSWLRAVALAAKQRRSVIAEDQGGRRAAALDAWPEGCLARRKRECCPRYAR